MKNGEEIIGPDTTTAPEVIDANHGPLNLSYDNDR